MTTQKNHQTIATFVFISVALLITACGRFEANVHPDQLLEDSRNLATVSGLNNYMKLRAKNPLFRKAKVTTRLGTLKVRQQPSSFSQSPAQGPSSLSKNQSIDVYWPTEISNNHIKVLVANQPAWVTYKSQQGDQYVTLLEEIQMPKVTVPGYTVTARQPQQSPQPPASISSPIDVNSITLPSSAINEAHSAIAAVALKSSDINSCQFNPLVGNNQSSDNCYQHIVLSENFKNFVGQYGHQCAQQASRDAFGKTPNKILFHSSYAGQVRRNRTVSGTSKKSTHSTGQALDLFGISLYFNGGSSRRVTLHKNQTDGSSTAEKENNKFYWSYVNCWRVQVRSHAPCNCSDSKAGAMTYLENSAHHNHVHMSIPHCERKQYNVSCV